MQTGPTSVLSAVYAYRDKSGVISGTVTCHVAENNISIGLDKQFF